MSVRRSGAVGPTRGAIAALRPLDLGAATITGRFWADRLRLNRDATIPHGYAQLDSAGNFHDLRLAAGMPGTYQALGIMFGTPFPFLDSDVYKWLEAVGWELGRAPSPDLMRMGDTAIDLVERAQRADGYLNSFVQVLAPGREYADLRWGHELYCVGHLIQAAVAWTRAVGDDRLLRVAVRAADSIERELGPGKRAGLDGHPEIEMALVELFRTTGEERHLRTAAEFIGRRGRGLLGSDRYGAAYWQDHAPVREAPSAAGHAVRQLYLDCGAVDVATETGDAELLDGVVQRWHDMVATRTYLTGALGSRHRDEAFGDPYELPPDRAYAESCAAIASVMLAWRLLLATGDPTCAEMIERTMLNGVLPAIGRDGTSFFYVNPLQRRTERAPEDPGSGERHPWYPCACCPPNLMRTLASWEQLIATADGDGIQIHQYAETTVRAAVEGGAAELAVETRYPWDGGITATVIESPGTTWTLSLRRPAWASESSIRWPDGSEDGDDGSGWVRRGAWKAGDRVIVELPMRPRFTEPDPRIDAVRGCLAIERGPLVYCLETPDLPAGVVLEDVRLDHSTKPTERARPDLADGAIGVATPATVGEAPRGKWPYPPAGSPPGATSAVGEIDCIPYLFWANRGSGGMRVWVPRDPDPRDEVAG